MGLMRNRTLLIAAAIAGLLATFAGILASGPSGPIGTIMFVPWVALLATELGPTAGGVAGAAATALYFVAAETDGLPHDPVALTLRLAPLVGVGVAAGFSSRRISADALELQATNALQRALLDSTVDGICLTDLAGNLVLANAPLQRFALELGLPAHGAIQNRLLVLADRTTEPARFRERIQALGCDLAASEDEFELTESQRVFRAYTAPVARPDGTVVARIWTLREVTADRQLERLRDTFVGAVSHELLTPLTSISGFLEMLGDEECALSPSGRTYLSALRRGTTRLQRIVEDLLLVAQIEANRLELDYAPLDVAELAAATLEAARPAAAEQGIELSLDVANHIPLDADAGRLRQVLDNVVSNALKFTPEGGVVLVTLAEGDGNVRLEVSDSGMGIGAADQRRLFERFFRAGNAVEQQVPGTGLGLYICRAIAEAHDGSISVHSELGCGSTFRVELPAVRAAVPA